MKQICLFLLLFVYSISFAKDTKPFNNPPVDIVGGVEASPEEFPWQVSIMLSETGDINDAVHRFGGVIIDNRWILTVAHGLVDNATNNVREPEHLFVSAGNIKWREGVILRVKKVIVHCEYAENANDIALLELESPISFSRSISPINLVNSTAMINPGRTCISSGWGVESFNSTEPVNKLRKINLNLMREDIASDLMLRFGCATAAPPEQVIFAAQLLRGTGAGVTLGGNISNMDSGGGLITYYNGLPYLIGLNLVGCPSESQDPNVTGVSPAGFLNVYNYLSWIKDAKVPFKAAFCKTMWDHQRVDNTDGTYSVYGTSTMYDITPCIGHQVSEWTVVYNIDGQLYRENHTTSNRGNLPRNVELSTYTLNVSSSNESNKRISSLCLVTHCSCNRNTVTDNTCSTPCVWKSDYLGGHNITKDLSNKNNLGDSKKSVEVSNFISRGQNISIFIPSLMKNDDNYELMVTDLNGKVIIRKKIEYSTENITTENMPTGIYILKITAKDFSYNNKIILY